MIKVQVLVFVLIIFVSCNKILPGEHTSLSFENNSSEFVYVSSCLLNEELSSYHGNTISLGYPRESCEVPPSSINHNAAPIYGPGVAYSYEYVFSRNKSAEKCLVYVAPFYSSKEIGSQEPLYNYKLVCYELTFEDLVSLDFHLYYPPNEKMKNVKMEPPYESFAAVQ